MKIPISPSTTAAPVPNPANGLLYGTMFILYIPIRTRVSDDNIQNILGKRDEVRLEHGEVVQQPITTSSGYDSCCGFRYGDGASSWDLRCRFYGSGSRQKIQSRKTSRTSWRSRWSPSRCYCRYLSLTTSLILTWWETMIRSCRRDNKQDDVGRTVCASWTNPRPCPDSSRAPSPSPRGCGWQYHSCGRRISTTGPRPAQ